MRRFAPLSLLAFLLVLGTPAPTPLHAEDPTPALTLPAGRAVQIDGKTTAAEWEEATEVSLRAGGTDVATLRMLVSSGTLLLALESDQAWVPGAEWHVHLAPMVPAAGEAKDLGAWTSGAASIRFEPFHHDAPHVRATRQDGDQTLWVHKAVVVRTTLGGSSTVAEMAIQLKDLGLPEGMTDGRMLVTWSRPRSLRGMASWPAGLDLRARPGHPPVDMVRSTRWATVAGLSARGTGAFSRTIWDAWVAADEEITRKGAAAHALSREMIEERQIFLKQDTRVEEELLAPLRWIGEREPLSLRDHTAIAQALRQLNRHDEALALFRALATAPGTNHPAALRYEEARTLHRMERFAEEAAVWRALAESRRSGRSADQYRRAAGKADAYAERLATERKADAEARAQEPPRPLVRFVTNRGDILVACFPAQAPKAVAHFLSLVETDFYDGTRFHRVIGEFVAQGGSPDSRDGPLDEAGSGTSEAMVDIEENPLHGFWRGALAFAVGRVQANGSQFFFLTAPRPELKKEAGQAFTVFGRVRSGMDVVDRLEYGDTLLRAEVLRGETPR